MIMVIASGGLGASGIFSLITLYNTQMQILASVNGGIASRRGHKKPKKLHHQHSQGETHFSHKSML